MSIDLDTSARHVSARRVPKLTEAEVATRRARPLNEVAKKLAYPSGITKSGWGDVRNICENKLQLDFDGWQHGAGNLLLAKREDGALAHTVGGFGLSICRQTGKTFFVAGSIFGLSVAMPGMLTIWSAHHSKALDCQTEILTANRGWVTMDLLSKGDEVFHPSGRPTKIVGTSQINSGHDCYEVITMDGRKVVADAGHLWTVTDKNRKLSSGSGKNRKRWLAPPVTMTTQEMYDAGMGTTGVVKNRGRSYRTGKYRFLLPRQHRVEGLPAQDLSIDPYLLGAWLGDGSSDCATLTCASEDLIHWSKAIGAAGYLGIARKPANRAWRIAIQGGRGNGALSRSFRGKLNDLGVLKNKHIPERYFVGSTEQRLALLQGLLDTDGSINKDGNVWFTSTIKDLSEGVLYLARSLGWRASLREDKAKIDGRETCPIWQVTFTPKLSDGVVPFRLERKAVRIKAEDTREGRFSIAIKSIEPVATRPVRCIKVAAEDGLFLAGRDLIPTHNTHNETFQGMQAFAERKAIAPFIQKVYTGSGDEEVRFRNGSRILFGARERGFGRGIPGVDCLVSDEAQILSENAMQNMLATMNTSQLGLHIYAGTPPRPQDNSESWLRMRDEVWVDGPDGPKVVFTEDLVWIEMGASDDADLDDYSEYAKANPSFPHRTPLASMQRLRRKLKDDGFRREALGIYDKQESSVFDIEKWNTLKDLEAPDLTQAVLMVDISPDRRWSTIGLAGDFDEDGDETLVLVHSMRGTDGVIAKIKDLMEKISILEVNIFAGGTARILRPDLEDEAIEYEEMNANELAAAYGYLQEKIKAGRVRHLDQTELNVALEMTKTRFVQTGEAESFDRREYSVDVSPAVAAAGAMYRWNLIGRMPVIL